jgi:hypothetical protein
MGRSTLGLGVIMVLYATVGVMAAAGAVFITQKILRPKGEQIFYGLFLVLIAAFYLAFAAYFESASAWRVETAAVVAFAVIGLIGVRLPIALVIGYPVHGLWDLVHELSAHGTRVGFEPEKLTAVPLAYGVFCAAFDVCIAVYAWMRRAEWAAGWESPRVKAAEPVP